MSMGPTIIIFHETRYTDVLSEFKNGQVRNAENIIRKTRPPPILIIRFQEEFLFFL